MASAPCVARFLVLADCLLALTATAAAGKPVPTAQSIPLPHHEVSFQREGRELARFHSEPEAFRPYVFPVIGPSGRSLTRLGHPHDPVSHSHHNSVWISHNDVNGVNFWEDRGRGRISVLHTEQLEDGDEEAAVVTVAEWRGDGTVMLNERRRTGFRPLPNDEWLLLIDLLLVPSGTNDVALGKTPFGLIGVRVAKTIGVNDGGGTIRNSEGAVDEKEVFWKPAKWVDYSGPVTPHASEGVTLLDHPENPNHPTVFHVRNDGWMGASFTFDEPRVIRPGESLQVRYGLYVHAGVPKLPDLQRVWEEFARLPRPDLQKRSR
jgi:hypothetical protein